MKTKQITIYHALCDGKVALPSLTPISIDDLQEYHWFDEKLSWSIEIVTREVPFEVGKTQLWKEDLPHVHYACCHCGGAHNFDLDLSYENPRLAICDYGKMGDYTLVEWKPHEIG